MARGCSHTTTSRTKFREPELKLVPAFIALNTSRQRVFLLVSISLSGAFLNLFLG
jgi:hypothetical protein